MTSATSKDDLLRTLTTRTFGRTLFLFDEIDSTNTCAMTLAETDAPDGTVVWAEYQIAGKGRLGRSWKASQGDNLTFSLILRNLPVSQLSWVPYHVAEGIAGGIEKVVDLDIRTKWPNDLMIDGKKFCGTLLESTGSRDAPSVVAGIGINVNQSSFPPDIEHSATSLYLETGVQQDRVRIFQSVMENLEALFDEVRAGRGDGIVETWKDRCQTLGKEISVRSDTETVHGRAIGLADDGGLILDTSDGLRTVYAGDVTLSGGVRH